MFGPNKQFSVAEVPLVPDDAPDYYESKLNANNADEAYAHDLIDTARKVLMRVAGQHADLRDELDEEVRALLALRGKAEVGSGRAAFLADAVQEPVTLVTGD